MKINSEKFQCIVFGNVYGPNEFNIDILPENCVKLLGLYIDNKLNIYYFITNISQMASKQVNVLPRPLLHITSTYEELLQICRKSHFYIVRLRKTVELTYMLSNNNCTSYLNSLVIDNMCDTTPHSGGIIQIQRLLSSSPPLD